MLSGRSRLWSWRSPTNPRSPLLRLQGAWIRPESLGFVESLEEIWILRGNSTILPPHSYNPQSEPGSLHPDPETLHHFSIVQDRENASSNHHAGFNPPSPTTNKALPPNPPIIMTVSILRGDSTTPPPHSYGPGLMADGLGITAQGLGFQVQGRGFRDHGSGLRV